MKDLAYYFLPSYSAFNAWKTLWYGGKFTDELGYTGSSINTISIIL